MSDQPEIKLDPGELARRFAEHLGLDPALMSLTTTRVVTMPLDGASGCRCVSILVQMGDRWTLMSVQGAEEFARGRSSIAKSVFENSVPLGGGTH